MSETLDKETMSAGIKLDEYEPMSDPLLAQLEQQFAGIKDMGVFEYRARQIEEMIEKRRRELALMTKPKQRGN